MKNRLELSPIKPMRILWVSARIFDDNEETESGVWLKALATKLMSSPSLTMANIGPKNNISDMVECDYKEIKQWAFPRDKHKNGYPPKETELMFEKVVSSYMPDIIQIWGSENFLKLLPFDQKYSGIKVLTMQGVLDSIAPHILSGLSYRELISTIGIREILLRKTIFTVKNSFIEDGKIENDMIKKSDFIITQSDWTDSQIITVNSTARLYRTHRALRDAFINSKKWTYFKHESPIIYSAALGYSLKGLHILIKAMGIVKKQFPDVELTLAGTIGRTDILGDGYLRLIMRMIKKYDLENNITWLGSVTAPEIVKILQNASVFVNPSFVESYSLVFAEAMSVGTPSVISFAGAMPELAENNKEALFFTPGDYKSCAFMIIKLLSDNALSKVISENAVLRSVERNIKFDIVHEQIDIYKDMLNIGYLR